MLEPPQIAALIAESMAINGYLPKEITIEERVRTIQTAEGSIQLQDCYSSSSHKRKKVISPDSCVLCSNSPARDFPLHGLDLQLEKRNFLLHMTPFSIHHYGHFICSLREHAPMVVNRTSIGELLRLATRMHCYTVGMDADLPNCGSSILPHLHYHAFYHCRVPAMRATGRKIREEVEYLMFPSTAFRFSGAYDYVVPQASELVEKWRARDPNHTVSLIAYATTYHVHLLVFLRDSRLVSQNTATRASAAGFLEMAGNVVVTRDIFDTLVRLPDTEVAAQLTDYIGAHAPKISDEVADELASLC